MSFNIIMADKPVVKELPEKTTIIVGEKAELTCEASGDPQPSVTWSKDGDTSIPRANFNNDGKVLVIRDVIPRDSGVYECTASNSFGVSHSATTLIVTGKLEISTFFVPHVAKSLPIKYFGTSNSQRGAI